jgi:hypothetical protein
MSSVGLRLWTAVPVLTALLGTGAIAGGISSFTSPRKFAELFGIALPASSNDINQSNAQTDVLQRAYIQIQGLRNIASGVGLVSLTAFWSVFRNSPVASETIKQCIAISLTTGTLVTLGDGYILSKILGARDLSQDAYDLAKDKSKGHILTTIPIAILAYCWII